MAVALRGHEAARDLLASGTSSEVKLIVGRKVEYACLLRHKVQDVSGHVISLYGLAEDEPGGWGGGAM